ncbi:ABC transporter permease [Shimazuella sp. AN120528]|uniref:ABC transporter permease n=1 Tax=Shimazuella soli TaxID=1892854 RepID=UPI001F0F3D05|nr:ABC transporter permease [Shimazuella soli]MCH5584625.1 ABC transporter permease [Shimazuella soli]
MNSTKKLQKSWFEPLAPSEKNSEVLAPQTGYWKDAWRRFKANKGALIGLVLIILLLLIAFIGPLLNGFDYSTQNLSISNQEHLSGHFLGTDSLGRDLWQRVWYGAKVSLLIAFIAAFLDVVIGVTFGGISGYFGGRVDSVMQRILEIMYSIPNIVVIILLMMYLEPGILPIAVALAFTGWVPMARVVRAQILKLKTQEYVLAARTMGASHFRILFKHLIPNVVGPIIIAVTFSIPSAIFFEAFLSFIGLGLRSPAASLGILVNDGYRTLQLFPYQLFWPALVLCIIMLSFNLIGDGLRDALDPKMKK